MAVQLTAESVSGKFTQILNSTNYADANNELTLGALSFKMYHPNELKVPSPSPFLARVPAHISHSNRSPRLLPAFC